MQEDFNMTNKTDAEKTEEFEKWYFYQKMPREVSVAYMDYYWGLYCDNYQDNDDVTIQDFVVSVANEVTND
jgi:hypothetical protein